MENMKFQTATEEWKMAEQDSVISLKVLTEKVSELYMVANYCMLKSQQIEHSSLLLWRQFTATNVAQM